MRQHQRPPRHPPRCRSLRRGLLAAAEPGRVRGDGTGRGLRGGHAALPRLLRERAHTLQLPLGPGTAAAAAGAAARGGPPAPRPGAAAAAPAPAPPSCPPPRALTGGLPRGRGLGAGAGGWSPCRRRGREGAGACGGPDPEQVLPASPLCGTPSSKVGCAASASAAGPLSRGRILPRSRSQGGWGWILSHPGGQWGWRGGGFCPTSQPGPRCWWGWDGDRSCPTLQPRGSVGMGWGRILPQPLGSVGMGWERLLPQPPGSVGMGTDPAPRSSPRGRWGWDGDGCCPSPARGFQQAPPLVSPARAMPRPCPKGLWRLYRRRLRLHALAPPLCSAPTARPACPPTSSNPRDQLPRPLASPRLLRWSVPASPLWAPIGSWRREGRALGRGSGQWAASPVSVRRALAAARVRAGGAGGAGRGGGTGGLRGVCWEHGGFGGCWGHGGTGGVRGC